MLSRFLIRRRSLRCVILVPFAITLGVSFIGNAPSAFGQSHSALSTGQQVGVQTIAPSAVPNGNPQSGSTVRQAPDVPAACANMGKRWSDKRERIESIGQKIYQSPPSVKEISCLDNLLNIGGNFFFSLPDLSGLLDQITSAMCRRLDDKFQEMTRPLEEALSLSGEGLELPGGIYVGGPRMGLRVGGSTHSSSRTVNWGTAGSSSGSVPTIKGPFSGYAPSTQGGSGTSGIPNQPLDGSRTLPPGVY
jgi:hypothetical protein